MREKTAGCTNTHWIETRASGAWRTWKTEKKISSGKYLTHIKSMTEYVETGRHCYDNSIHILWSKYIHYSTCLWTSIMITYMLFKEGFETLHDQLRLLRTKFWRLISLKKCSDWSEIDRISDLKDDELITQYNEKIL